VGNVSSDTGRFAIIPEWILCSEIGGTALRLYGVLALHADYDSGRTKILRKTLAKKVGCSVDTIDRALKELDDIGAVDSTHQYRENKQEPNLYRIYRVKPGTEPFRLHNDDQSDLHPAWKAAYEWVEEEGVGRKDAAGVGRKDAAQNETNLEREQSNPSAATSSPQPEKVRDPVWDTLVEFFGEPTTPGEKSDFGKTVRDIKAAMQNGYDERDLGGPGGMSWSDYVSKEITRRVESVDEQYRSHRSLRNRWTEMGLKGDPPDEGDANGRTPDPEMEPCLYCAGTGHVHYIDGAAHSIEGDSGEPGVTICKDCGGTGDGTY